MIQIQTTVGKKKDAEKIAEALVKNKIAACVQILPINSVYRWKGKIEKEKEYLLLIKGKDYKKIEKALTKIHPYDIPEIIQIKITKASKPYSKWINKETH